MTYFLNICVLITIIWRIVQSFSSQNYCDIFCVIDLCFFFSFSVYKELRRTLLTSKWYLAYQLFTFSLHHTLKWRRYDCNSWSSDEEQRGIAAHKRLPLIPSLSEYTVEALEPLSFYTKRWKHHANLARFDCWRFTVASCNSRTSSAHFRASTKPLWASYHKWYLAYERGTPPSTEFLSCNSPNQSPTISYKLWGWS